MIKRTLFFAKPAYLNTKDNQLIVHYPDENKQKVKISQRLKQEAQPKRTPQIPIEDIAVIVLENPQITISNGLVRKLLQNNVALIHCDEKHMPVGTFLPLRGHSEQSERFSVTTQSKSTFKEKSLETSN